MANTLEQTRDSLIKIIKRQGFPEEFGAVIADTLATEKQMTRMASWMIQYRPGTMEEIADEMISIKEEFERYRKKKMNEYYNMKYNELLNEGLEEE